MRGRMMYLFVFSDGSFAMRDYCTSEDKEKASRKTLNLINMDFRQYWDSNEWKPIKESR
jgi:hypothetical protein